MARRRVSNPLALAVLGLLIEGPMHPYEMSSTLRERAKEESIKLNYGSLYSVVDSLLKRRLIEVHDVVRSGRRPERTVYAITDSGRAEYVDWLSELIAVPSKEYTRFEAALSLLPSLPPDEVLRLLRMRLTRLEAEISGADAVMTELSKQGIAYMFVIESDYVLALRRAEARFVERLIGDIEAGTFPDLDVWRQAHRSGDLPDRQDWERAAGQATGSG